MEVFAALADPVRRDIVQMLATGDRTAGEIAARFPVSGPAISRHLRVLRESGVASCRHDAQRRIYSLNAPAVAELEEWAEQLLEQWRHRFDALGRHLDKKAASKGGKR